MQGSDIAGKLCLVTGASRHYFLVVATLVESLRVHMPSLAVRVMDLGFTPGQARFLDRLGLLLPMPPHFPPELHPYLLKASMHEYVAGAPQFDHFIWIDSDMICVSDGTERLLQVIASMRKERQNLALAADLGPNPTPRQFAQTVDAPVFRRYLDQGAIPEDATYLNAGFVIFLDARAQLKRWQQLANVLFEDKCYDQNALNLMFYGDPAAARLLDARDWNLHGDLLSDVVESPEGLMCRGEKALFVHCTSYMGALHEDTGLKVDVPEGEIRSNYKFFRNPLLKKRQTDFMDAFLKRYIAQMRADGVPQPAKPSAKSEERRRLL